MKKKDPATPRPPLNPYMEFFREERERIVLETGGGLSTTDIAKAIGTRWRKLSEEEKMKYEQRYLVNKKEYLENKAEHAERTNMQDIEASKAKSKSKKKRKDSFAPKLPLSSFMEFGKLERPKILAELGALPIAEVGRELGNRWRSLSKEEKKQFEEKSKENKLRYKKEKENRVQQGLSDLINKSGDGNAGSPPEEGPGGESSTTSPSSDPEAGTVEESEGPSNARPSEPDAESVTLNDLGFAQQKRFPWHPAMKTGTLAKGTRIKVTMFGTGETVTVDRSKGSIRIKIAPKS